LAEQKTNRTNILGYRLEAFETHGSAPLDSILRLGHEADIPVGIEYIDYDMLVASTSKRFEHQPIENIVSALLSQGRGYTVSLVNGAMLISNIHLPKGNLNLLDIVINRYDLRRPATLQEAAILLYMTLDSQVNGPKGYAGSISPGDMRNLIGPFSINNARVSDVLSRLVALHGHAAWIATAPPRKLNQMGNKGPWIIVEYSQPAQDYSQQLKNSPAFSDLRE
jgi:hypothetical protein